MFFYCFAAFLLLAPLYKAGNRPVPLLLLELAAIGFLFVIVAVHRAPARAAAGDDGRDRRAARLSAAAARSAAGCALAGAAGHAAVCGGARPVRGRRAGWAWRAISVIPAATEYGWLALLPPLACLLGAMRLSTGPRRAAAAADGGVRRRRRPARACCRSAPGGGGLLYLGNEEPGQNAAIGTFVNRNHLAAMLAMALPVIVGLLVYSMRPGCGGTGRAGAGARVGSARAARAAVRVGGDDPACASCSRARAPASRRASSGSCARGSCWCALARQARHSPHRASRGTSWRRWWRSRPDRARDRHRARPQRTRARAAAGERGFPRGDLRGDAAARRSSSCRSAAGCRRSPTSSRGSRSATSAATSITRTTITCRRSWSWGSWRRSIVGLLFAAYATRMRELLQRRGRPQLHAAADRRRPRHAADDPAQPVRLRAAHAGQCDVVRDAGGRDVPPEVAAREHPEPMCAKRHRSTRPRSAACGSRRPASAAHGI